MDMFYQEALPKFCFVSHVNSLLTIGAGHWKKLAIMFEKAKISKFTSICTVKGAFHVGCLFCMGGYKCDGIVVIKMGAYIHDVLVLFGCLLS